MHAAHPNPVYPDDAQPISYPIDSAMRGLAIGRTKLYELIGAGELETYMIGKRRYVSRAAMERFIARREAEERAVRTRLGGGAA